MSYRAPYGANKFSIVQRIEVQCAVWATVEMTKVHYAVWIEQCGLAIVEDTVYSAVQCSSVGIAIWHSVEQCGPVHCSVVQCGPVWSNVVLCTAVGTSVVQCPLDSMVQCGLTTVEETNLANSCPLIGTRYNKAAASSL